MGVGDEIRGDEIWEGGRKFVGMKSRGDEICRDEIWGDEIRGDEIWGG